ncbi:MAG: hypothetical protein GX053_12335 [Tissierella sp.]|nr:hypothetical protein [Tissierella sp.]
MDKIIIENIFPILSAILTTIITTILISYFKNRKIKNLKLFIEFSRELEVINSLIRVLSISLIVAILYRVRSRLDPGVSDRILFIICIVASLILMIMNVWFRRYDLKILLTSRKKRIIYYATVILLLMFLWIGFSIIYSPILGNDKIKGLILIEYFSIYYVIIFAIKARIINNNTKVYDKIMVTTKELGMYCVYDLKYFDEFISFTDIETGNRVLLLKTQVLLIEFKGK